MVTDYFRKVRGFFSRNYHQRVRVDGEQAMDNLIGTMLGVLFLAIISASFAGIYMAYSVSTAKATENNERNNMVVKFSTNTLNSLYVESINGRATAAAAGWTVLSQEKALSAVTPALNPAPSAAFTTYTYAATRPMVAGGTTLISQWGINKNGLITLYTATPKAGSGASKCNWTESQDKLETFCVVAIDRIQSVVSPPLGLTDENAVRWAEKIVQYPWTAAPFDWATATKRDVTTSKLGVINTKPDLTKPNVRDFKYVVMFENLTPGKKVSIDFVESKNGAYSSQTFVAGENGVPLPGPDGKITVSHQATVTIPDGANSMDVYIDTDVAQPNNALDQTVKISRFIVYTIK